MITIRALRPEDVPLGMRLKGQAGWNQTPDDWRRMLALQPDGCFVARCEGCDVATLVTCRFDHVAWIAMVLCDEAFRGRGIATQLMRHALSLLDETGVRSVRLDATGPGRPVYEKFGFRVDRGVTRFAGGSRFAPADGLPTPTVNVISIDDLPQAAAVDRRATGTDRRRLLRLLSTPEHPARGVFSHGKLAGYLCERAGSDALQIGPCAADDEAAGAALLDDALCRAGDRPVVVDVLDDHHVARSLIVDHGLVAQRSFFRMTRGPAVDEDVGRLWASSGPELG